MEKSETSTAKQNNKKPSVLKLNENKNQEKTHNMEDEQLMTVSEQLDQVVQIDETQKNIWVLFSMIAKELGIDKKSDLKTIIEATVNHYEKHKKIMTDYQEVMKKTRS